VLDFHPRILGLTGSHDQLHDVTKAFRVYHSPSPKDDDGDYLVSTLALVFIIVLKIVQRGMLWCKWNLGILLFHTL